MEIAAGCLGSVGFGLRRQTLRTRLLLRHWGFRGSFGSRYGRPVPNCCELLSTGAVSDFNREGSSLLFCAELGGAEMLHVAAQGCFGSHCRWRM